MVNKIMKRIFPIILSVMLLVTALPMQFTVSATTVNVLDGQVSVTDTANTVSVSGGTVTATVKGGMFSKATNTITVTNETVNRATLSFDYTATSANSFTISGASANASGTYSVLLDAGATLIIAITSNSGFSNLTATLKLSNFSLTTAAATSNVTVVFDSSLGSVTVDDATVSSGHVQENIVSGTSVALVATANSGVTFYGWIDTATGEVLSSDAEYTYEPTADVTIKPVFMGSGSPLYFMLSTTKEETFKNGLLNLTKNTYYTVNSATHIFDDFALASSTAAATTSKVIVPLNDGEIPSGDYTIPSGVTLLIPFDSNNTLYTTAAQSLGTYTTPTAYRTLTLASGANITVDGAISVSAKHHYAQGKAPTNGGGTPIGNVGFIKMSEGSSITVNNGGTLYVYGFVTGKGNITANSGATVYENFQIMDFRGGTQSTEMENGVFPISQYYVQNIEVPLTLECGAIEYGLTTIYMSSTEFMSAVAFIGPSNSMFNLTSGYIVKTYDGTTDRLNIELNGDMTVSPIDLTIGTSSINSKNYELAVNGNITLDVKGGSNVIIGQDMAVLPGSEILIAEGAKCTLGSGINFYIYDADEWGNYVFTNAEDVALTPVKYAPGSTYTRTAADLVDAKIQVDGTIDASQGYVYTTAGGANIYSTGTGVAKVTNGTQTTTHQYKQASTTYVEIPITPAKFKNADGTYLQSYTDTYNYVDGVWVCTNHDANEASCTADGICKACGAVKTPATGHTAGADATCTTAQTCTVCGTEMVAALGHSYNVVVTEPTCTEGGYTTHTCSVCGYSKVDSETEATGHNYTSVVIDPECEKDGYTEYTCVQCGDTYTDNIVTATGHNYEAVVTAPTCTEGGYTTHTCPDCGDSYVDGETEATGHTAGADATCTTAQTCTVCGTELVAAKGHSYEEEVTAPTCTEDGYTTHTCPDCGDSYVDGETEATGHTAGADATCTTAQTCTVCGTELVAAKGHSYSEFVVDSDATHSVEGSKSATCSACGDVITEKIPVIVCDIDGDGITGKAEYKKMRLFLLGIRTPDSDEFVMFDMNDDGIINVVDFAWIYKVAEQNGITLK